MSAQAASGRNYNIQRFTLFHRAPTSIQSDGKVRQKIRVLIFDRSRMQKMGQKIPLARRLFEVCFNKSSGYPRGAGKKWDGTLESIWRDLSQRPISFIMEIYRMPSPQHAKRSSGDEFAIAGGVDFEFSFAFQPIVNAATREVISFEALVRGPGGEPSADVFARVPRENLYRFDQACRLKAIHIARRLNLQTRLNINLFPNAVYRTGMNIRATLQASLKEGFPVENIIFEVSEAERLVNYPRVVEIFKAYQDFGFQTAIDDFGTGYSGLKMLVEYQPNYIKLDRNLIADIQEDHIKQTLVKGISYICKQLSIEMMAEGVETAGEYAWLRESGINIFQGYYFARPTFEALAEVQPKLF